MNTYAHTQSTSNVIIPNLYYMEVKLMKTGTSPKTLRIPNDTIADIERVAKEKKTSFSKEANRRLNGRNDDTKYPLFLAKTQTIINLCWEGVRTGSEEPIRKAQEEERKLWTKIMTSSK